MKKSSTPKSQSKTKIALKESGLSTESIRMEESLATERSFLRQVIDTVPAFICVKNEEGSYALANESLAKAYGTTVSGVEGKTDLDFSPTPEEAAAFRKDDLEVIHSQKIKTIAEEPITYADGTIHWYSTTKIPIIDPDSSCSKVLVIAMDITELREHRENLQMMVKRQTEELTASQVALVEAQAVAHMGNWEWDAIGDRITGSDEFYRLFGIAPKDLTRFSQFVERLHPDDRERVQRDVDDALKQDRNYDTDYRVKIGKNSWRSINARGRIFTDTAGKAARMVGTCLDITERKRAEEELRESREKYYYLYENSPVGMYQTKIDGSGIIEINNTACEMMGFAKEELMGQPSAIRWADPNRRTEIVKIMTEYGVATNFDADILKKDGTSISCLLSMKIFKENGYIEGFITDISDRKRAEKSLSNSEQSYRRLNEDLENRVKERTEQLESVIKEHVKSKKLLDETGRLARVGGWEIDLKSNTLYWSETTYKIHEVDPGFVPNLENAINFYAPEAVPVISSCVEKAIANGEPFDEELELITAKKNRIWVRAIGEAYTENGKIVKIGGVFQDINTTKLIREEIKKHRDHLEEMVRERTLELNSAISDLKHSNQELEQFAYVASHDLQEPLRMVSSYTQLLERRYKEHLDQDAKDFINFAVDGANRMQHLINDLLEYSRVTTKGKPFQKLDLSAILGAAVANLQKRIQETGAMIVNDDLPFVYGDEVQLIRVFQNLLDNAMKFSGNEPPRINVIAKTIDDKVQVSVSDNGIGIDMIYGERIFAIFQRLHTKVEYPGTGIGLAICKRTIERHGGKIWFESEQGTGTTFSFTLNYK
jgi:PAS domain S-box-containing protein